MSTTDNTLQNYITKYTEQAFAAHTGNRYDKLYRELLSSVEGIIKLTVNQAKRYDKDLENLYNDPRFNKKFIRTFAKHQILEFLDTHPKKKEVVTEFNSEHHINESDLKILEEGKDLIDKINDINLTQQNEKGEELNIKTVVAQSIGRPSSQVGESKATSVNICNLIK
ncbi:hypothetical protein [Wolbachia endosymbiont of Ctenocephalides felis wCfeJ]|uniref:hypothetical protein n=1 Tax=Wolbachia endosymbiont of Ctenocephalides felis wCfeJ TaxID=2732594 RepID=UPI001448109B|nr:hypothetical protein [Wolbachia endosymbiont of Ctenocephalides felis wCfeJ]WCR57925.1 MAG: hypothetical protein PG980_000397 [Wolbachia endosymbiont of Ctenocephalides felis wCfeJ]